MTVEDKMPASTHAHIELNADGVPVITGTTMKIVELVRFHLHQNWDARELHEQFPYLTLGQIHSALSYFHDNEAEIRADLARREELVEQIRKKWEDSPVQQKLRKLKHG
jgi:uncharacterized protein (DUF433 family)